MISYLNIKGNNGDTIITDNRINYWLQEKHRLSYYQPTVQNIVCSVRDGGTTVSMRDLRWRYLYTANLSVTDDALVLVYPSAENGNFAYRGFRDYVNNIYTVEVYAKSLTGFNLNNIYVYIFTPSTYHSRDKFGLEVRNAAGSTIFHSSDYTLDIVDWKVIHDETWATYDSDLAKHNAYSLTVPAGKRYAAAPAFLFSASMWAGFTENYSLYPTNSAAFIYANNKITFGECTMLKVMGSEWVTEQLKYVARYQCAVSEFLIVDVTHIPTPTN